MAANSAGNSSAGNSSAGNSSDRVSGYAAASTVEQRIGDAERDRATEYLREHMASGRLDSVEFDERLEKALTAHYQSDLDQLFVDLPAPRPEAVGRTATPPHPTPEPATAPVAAESGACANTRPPAHWSLVVGLAWAAAISLSVISGWHLWWLIFVPLLMSGGFGRHQHRHLQRQQMRTQQLQFRQMQVRQMHTRVRGMR